MALALVASVPLYMLVATRLLCNVARSILVIELFYVLMFLSFFLSHKSFLFLVLLCAYLICALYARKLNGSMAPIRDYSVTTSLSHAACT